jgi:hypothetical protein
VLKSALGIIREHAAQARGGRLLKSKMTLQFMQRMNTYIVF